jgi:hypothetical protein
LISVSIQDVQQNPQSVSNFYLANLQSLAQSKQPETSTPPQFNPPTTAVWVNSLWFLSLAINLACSVLANLLQQWARRYIRGTHTRYSPKKRARTRAFYARGVEKFRLPLVFEALPAMLHLSVFLFAAGLVVFLWNIDPILSKVVAVWLAICLFLYYFFTLGPIEYHDSPYDTPLSMPVWYLWTRIHFLIVWNLGQFTCFSASSRLQTLERKYRKFLGQGFFKTANKTALKSPFEVDTAFLNDLEEDPDMDHLFAGLHTSQGSKPDPLSDVAKKAKAKQMKAFVGYLDSTFSSDFLTELSMARRAIFYANALDPAELPHAHQFILDGVLSGDHHKGLKSAEFGRFMRGWSDGGDGTSASVVQAICSGIVAKARRRDDSWFAFASDEMVILEPDLRAYAAHGKSLSLAIFIHLARQQFSHFGDSSWPEAEFSKVLGEAASKFKVQHTLPELQHKFCALWNEIVLKARTDNNNWTIAGNILGQMRGIYNTLHPETGSATTRPPAPAPAPGTDNVVTHPACNVPDHIPSAASAPTILFDNGAPVSASLASRDLSFSLILSPLHVTGVPPPDNEAPVPGPSHLARETTTKGLHPADAFPDTIVPRVTGSIDTSIVTIPLTTLASAPPPTSAPGVSGHRTAPDDPGVPSAIDLGNIIPIG